jgi:hypothetical protein
LVPAAALTACAEYLQIAGFSADAQILENKLRDADNRRSGDQETMR